MGGINVVKDNLPPTTFVAWPPTFRGDFLSVLNGNKKNDSVALRISNRFQSKEATLVLLVIISIEGIYLHQPTSWLDRLRLGVVLLVASRWLVMVGLFCCYGEKGASQIKRGLLK